MRDIRVTFKKLDSLKYISHLDLNRMFLRMIKRSKLKIWFTQGFNPHAHLVFSPPVSVGISSLCEILDFRILNDISNEEILVALNTAKPEGIELVSLEAPINKIHKIAFAKYKISIKTLNTIKELDNLKKSDTIIVVKRTKTREINFDIKEYFQDIIFEKNGDLIDFEVTLPCSQDLTLKVDLVLSVIKNVTYKRITRIKFLDENNMNFK